MGGILVYGLLYMSGEKAEQRHYWRVHEHLADVKWVISLYIAHLKSYIRT